MNPIDLRKYGFGVDVDSDVCTLTYGSSEAKITRTLHGYKIQGDCSILLYAGGFVLGPRSEDAPDGDSTESVILRELDRVVNNLDF